jgi:hypothetical protein
MISPLERAFLPGLYLWCQYYPGQIDGREGLRYPHCSRHGTVSGTEMNKDERKAAVAAYKERKPAAGIFAVRCAPSGQVWVGQTPNLGTIQNRIWFTLRLGTSSNRDLQSAWSAHGGENFTFEPLEQLEDEELPYVRDAVLKERALHWRSMLNASII